MFNFKYLMQITCMLLVIGINGEPNVPLNMNNFEFKASRSNLSFQYDSTSKMVRVCERQNKDIRLTLNTTIHYVNILTDKLVVYPLTIKYATKYFIYRNLEDVKTNKHYYVWSIAKFFGFRLNKPVSNMQAVELFSLFTLLGPGGKYDDNIEYSLEIPSAKIIDLDQNKCYLSVYFEAPLPDEVEDIVNEKLKFVNPIIVRNVIAQSVLIEKKDIVNLPPCS